MCPVGRCREEPQIKWLDPEQMTQKFEALGFKDDVKKLHVSKCKCWEIYGHDKAGKKIEVYFNLDSAVDRLPSLATPHEH